MTNYKNKNFFIDKNKGIDIVYKNNELCERYCIIVKRYLSSYYFIYCSNNRNFILNWFFNLQKIIIQVTLLIISGKQNPENA